MSSLLRFSDSRDSIPWSLVLLGAVVVQFLLVGVTFPVTELLTSKPLLNVDASIHIYRIASAIELAATGALNGYDPFFSAGQLAGIHHNPAAKLPAFLAFVFDGTLSPEQVWKLYSFSLAVLAPVCVPAGLRALGLPRSVCWVGYIAATLLWWTSYFRWFHTVGMVSFVFAAHLGFVFIAWVIRWISGTGGMGALTAMGLLGALGTFIHPLFPLPIAVCTICYLLVHVRQLNWPRVLTLLVVVPAISLAPNLLWLYGALTHDSGEPIRISHQSVVDANMIWRELTGQWRGTSHGSKTYPMLAMMALIGCFLPRDRHTVRLSIVFFVSGAILILYAALGAQVQQLAVLTQPNRFAPVGYLLFVAAAACGTVALGSTLLRSAGPARIACIGVGFVLLSLFALNLNELRREISYADIGHYGLRPPEVRGVGDDSRFIQTFLTDIADEPGRVLFETSRARIHDMSHIAGFLAYTTRREFIGGPYVGVKFANFVDGLLFGTSIDRLSMADFMTYADLYNLRWAIVHSEQSQDFMDNHPSVNLIDQSGSIAVYGINRPDEYFVVGSGRVEQAVHNRLELSGLSGDEIILKYHYLRNLASEPEAELTPVWLLDDPVPFIRVTNPPSGMTLFMK